VEASTDDKVTMLNLAEIVNGPIYYWFYWEKQSTICQLEYWSNSEGLEEENEFPSIKQEHLMGLNPQLLKKIIWEKKEIENDLEIPYVQTTALENWLIDWPARYIDQTNSEKNRFFFLYKILVIPNKIFIRWKVVLKY